MERERVKISSNNWNDEKKKKEKKRPFDRVDNRKIERETREMVTTPM